MIFDWYKLPIKLTEFLALEITSRELIVLLETIGRTEILLSRGNLVSITYKDVYLPVNLTGQIPFVSSGYASYLDADSNIYLGIEVAP